MPGPSTPSQSSQAQSAGFGLQSVRVSFVFLALLGSFLLMFRTQAQERAYRLLLDTLLQHSVPELSVGELKQLQAQHPNLYLLDTRAKEEYQVSKLPQGRWVGFQQFEVETVEDIPRSAHVVAYCSVGYRSEKVAEKLKEAGYQNVYNLYGGLFQWKNEGHPVVTPGGHKTEKVHAYDRKWGIWLRKGEKVY